MFSISVPCYSYSLPLPISNIAPKKLTKGYASMNDNIIPRFIIIIKEE